MQITQTFKYLDHLVGTSKAGNKYNMLKLSDGLETGVINTNDLSKSLTSEYQKGDDITVEITVNFFDNYNTFVIDAII